MGDLCKLMTLQERPQNVVEQSRFFNYKTINKSMRYASGHQMKDKMRPAFKFSKIMILRTKDRNLREK